MNGFIFFGLIGLFVSCIITFENSKKLVFKIISILGVIATLFMLLVFCVAYCFSTMEGVGYVLPN